MDIDFETRSPLDPGEAGSEVYARHPLTEVLCMAWVEDGFRGVWKHGDAIPIRGGVWKHGDAIPIRVHDHARQGLPFTAHGADFERAIWDNIMVPLYGWPPVKEWRCTMVLAGHRALPLGLDKAAEAVGLKERKDATGYKLMKAVSKPRKPKKRDGPDAPYWPEMTPEQEEALHAYCLRDVMVERALAAYCGDLPAELQREYSDTVAMNSRGVKIDVASARAASELIERVTGELEEAAREITGGAVTTLNQRDRILKFCAENGLALPDLTGDTVENNLRHEGPAGALIRLRAQAAKASNHKVAAMLRCTCDDGRARNLHQYHGADTGRDAGRLIQPQNFPRPDPAFEDYTEGQFEELLAVIRSGDLGLLKEAYGDPLAAISNALRAMITCEKGNELCASDLSGIEARVLAALAGETWKLKAFRDIDENGGADIYCRAAEAVFGHPVTKKDNPAERAVGKVLELACGYQGWLGAWRAFDKSDKHSDEDVEKYMGAWRDKHPRIVAFWRNLNDAAILCLTNKSAVETHGCVFDGREGPWMTLRLPSGRKLSYHGAKVSFRSHRYKDETEAFVEYSAWRYGQWRKVGLYGGRLAENVTQAVARDILFYAAGVCEDAGLGPVLRVHDELVLENPAGVISADHLSEILCSAKELSWVKELGVPLAADGWTGRRYRK